MMVTLMTKWPQLTPSEVKKLTLKQAEILLKGGNPKFNNLAEYQAWAQQRAR